MPEAVSWPLEGAEFVAGTGGTGVMMFDVRAILLVTACDAGSVTTEEVAEFAQMHQRDGRDSLSGGLVAVGTIAGV
jgi:hypothetical protein